jgi:hypothetical protein
MVDSWTQTSFHEEQPKEQGEASPNDQHGHNQERARHPQLQMQTVNSSKPILGPEVSQTTIAVPDKSIYKHSFGQDYMGTNSGVAVTGKNENKPAPISIASKRFLPPGNMTSSVVKKTGPTTIRSNYTDYSREKAKNPSTNPSSWTHNREYAHVESNNNSHVYASASKSGVNDHSFTLPYTDIKKDQTFHKKEQNV